MQDDLLWVYEGLTEYLGEMCFPARSGHVDAGSVSRRIWREWRRGWTTVPEGSWRNLQDTADAAAAALLHSACSGIPGGALRITTMKAN